MPDDLYRPSLAPLLAGPNQIVASNENPQTNTAAPATGAPNDCAEVSQIARPIRVSAEANYLSRHDAGADTTTTGTQAARGDDDRPPYLANHPFCAIATAPHPEIPLAVTPPGNGEPTRLVR